MAPAQSGRCSADQLDATHKPRGVAVDGTTRQIFAVANRPASGNNWTDDIYQMNADGSAATLMYSSPGRRADLQLGVVENDPRTGVNLVMAQSHTPERPVAGETITYQLQVTTRDGRCDGPRDQRHAQEL